MAYLRLVHMPFLFQFQFTSFGLLWAIFSLLIGAGYAFIFYNKTEESLTKLSKLLFAARMFAVALIVFLLFAPLIKTSNKTAEKPLILVLLDNSASINIAKAPNFSPQKYVHDIKNLTKEFNENYEVRFIQFGTDVKPFSNLQFNEKSTDIQQAFSYINQNYINRNIGAVVLSSDGIYNKGNSTEYDAAKIKAPIYTIALGDTIPKKDVLISNVNYNNLVFAGNDFQIEIDIEAFLCKGKSVQLSVTQNQSKIITKPISINQNEYHGNVSIILPATKRGLQKYTVRLSEISGELSKQNNIYTFFVDVVEGKKNIYILANGAHPDISAFKQALESNKNYEVKSGLLSNYQQSEIDKCQLLILHQLPAENNISPYLKKAISDKNCLFIIGDQTNVNTLTNSQNLLDISTNGLSQETFANVNDAFYEFNLSDLTKSRINGLPPLIAPFGSFSAKSDAAILLTQQIGKTETQKPLLVFSKSQSNKTAILCGEGIWRWRIDEFKVFNNHQATDELINKTVQYLCNNQDKKRFRAYPSKQQFDEFEKVSFNAELYNKSFELVNTPDVPLTIKSTTGKSFSYLFSRSEKAYFLNVGNLPAGEYQYSASSKLGPENFREQGKFIISHQSDELRQTTANHQLLNQLAINSKGEMINPDQIKDLPAKIKKNEMVKSIVYENRRYEELINFKMLFFAILALLSIEWFIRKRNGAF